MQATFETQTLTPIIALSDDSKTQLADITSEQPTPHKVHLRGVDDLTTDDIKAYATECYPDEACKRIEWINDTSVNIVYETPAIAMKGLAHLTADGVMEATVIPELQLRIAKSYSARPEAPLKVRTALFTDQKPKRAYEASRFYMMHPEHDPRERRRQGSSGPDEYRRRRYGKQEHRRRRRDDDEQGFDASMYDDNEDALAARQNGIRHRQDSRSTMTSEGEATSSKEGSRAGAIPSGPARRGRYGTNDRRRRSASPRRGGGNGRFGRRTPPPRYELQDPDPFPHENATKELFPSKSSSVMDIGAELRGVTSMAKGKELFPNKNPSGGMKSELFPNKKSPRSHRRSDAFDAADITADLFANGMSVPFVDGANERPTPAASRSLADRITDGSNFGRLSQNDPDPDPEALQDLENGGFSIRGIAKQPSEGFSIRGMASDIPTHSRVKELFPGKASGNAGKELFGGGLQSRGGPRNKASDMFY